MATNIILDLDSTVISSLRPQDKQPKALKGHNMMEDDQIEYIVYERPHLQSFLDFLFKNYRVAVWTAASKDYALFIIETILLQGKKGRKLDFTLWDYHGILSESTSDCPKDLTLVWNTFPDYNKDNTIIIDDYEAVYSPQMCNAYPIPPFVADQSGAEKDTELLKLQRKLEAQKGKQSCPSEGLLTEITLMKALAKAEGAL